MLVQALECPSEESKEVGQEGVRNQGQMPILCHTNSSAHALKPDTKGTNVSAPTEGMRDCDQRRTVNFQKQQATHTGG